MTKLIPLTKGLFATIDDGDYTWLAQWKWCVITTGSRKQYAGRRSQNVLILMHRFITNAPGGLDVDHKDGDGLNNQRHNLRIATRRQNSSNQHAQLVDKTSRFKGVNRDKQTSKWRASIRVNGKLRYLGIFADEADAASAYDAAARKHFGEFARLNFPTETEQSAHTPATAGMDAGDTPGA